MKKAALSILSILLLGVSTALYSQNKAMDFNRKDCDGKEQKLFTELDSGKAIVLFFFMPNCSSCPSPAQRVNKMMANLNMQYPGKVKGYVMPYNNSTTCAVSDNFRGSNYLTTFSALDSGAKQVAHYGGFGMPTVVLLGGKDHRVLFSTLSFRTADTTVMRDSIKMMLSGGRTGIYENQESVREVQVYPNPVSDAVNVKLELLKKSKLSISVLTLEGKKIQALLDENEGAGIVNKSFPLNNLAAGTYFIQIEAGGKSTLHKIQKIR